MPLENIDPEILGEFVQETLDQLNSLEEQFVNLEKSPDDLEIINAIFRPFHSIKGSAAFFDLTAMKDIAHSIENLLDDLRKERKRVTTDIISAILQGLDILKERLESLSNNSYQETLSSAESDYLNLLKEIDQSEPEEKALTLIELEINEVISDMGEGFIKKHPKVKKLIDLFSQLKSGSQIVSADAVYDPSLQYMYGENNLTEYISRFQQFITNAKVSPPSGEDCNAFSSTLDDLLQLCQGKSLESLLSILNGLKENFTTIMNSAAGFDELLLTLIEDDFNKLLKSLEHLSPGEAGAQKVGEILVAKGTITEKDLKEAVSKQKKVGEILLEEGKVSKGDIDHALTLQKEQITTEPVEKEKKAVFKTMRVEENKIDHFMSFVGELIVSSEVFNYLQKKIEKNNEFVELAKEYKNANLAFNDLSNNLQKSLMEIRKIPVKNLLQKMPRMVRDIAKNLGKNIALEITGEETRIDKSILENIENPLIHIVRNSADHGMETTSERAAAEKSEQGTIKINAFCDESFFHLRIVDDGKGINLEKVKQAALKKGVISESKYNSISDKEALHLIFLPGISLAKKVTDLSGRGVGMDVVMSNLKKVNGSINIDSELGKGTNIQIQIPLSVTLIVVDGLVVQVGEENFVIPIPKIKESIKPKSDDIFTVTRKGEMVTIRQKLFPLVRLHQLFKIPTKTETPSDGVVVLIQHENGHSCFLVDKLLGQQQVVQKDLGKYLKGVSTIAGGAIMGDGKIGLILNVEGIMNKVQK